MKQKVFFFSEAFIQARHSTTQIINTSTTLIKQASTKAQSSSCEVDVQLSIFSYNKGQIKPRELLLERSMSVNATEMTR